MKRSLLLSLLFFALSFINVNAQKAIRVGDLSYKILNDNSVEVYYSKKHVKQVIIPQTVNIQGKNYSVTTIGISAFDKCSSLTSVVIPNSVTTIGERAFFQCGSLTSVVIPNSLTTIGRNAFFDCTSLTSVVIPNSVTTISEMAFSDCSSLTSVVIPNSVTSIGYDAFYDCKSLKQAVMPDIKPNYKYDTNGSLAIFMDAPIETVHGNTIPYPSYIIEDKEDLFKYTPFHQLAENMRPTFSYYAQNRILEQITQWQKKKEYETTTQWQQRVTESSRKAKVNELIGQARKDFIAERAPESISGNLGIYDADYNTYPVKITGLNDTYIKVPIEDAPVIKQRWDSVRMLPHYGIINDRIGILSCDFKMGEKIYHSNQTYKNDGNDNVAVNLSPLQIDISGATNNQPSSVPTPVDYAIDKSIPTTSIVNDKTFAVVIGNEDYQQVAKVPYALNDSKVFSEYCQKTLGLPSKNIHYVANATLNNFRREVNWLKQVMEAYNGQAKAIFYYAGHGVPDEKVQTAYLLPIDGYGDDVQTGYKLDDLYTILGTMPSKSVIVFLDACFSGAQRGGGMLASARGIAIKVRDSAPKGNMVVFTAAQGDETAYSYKEKGHGMFTYFLLKEMHDTQGSVSFGDLANYIKSNVCQQSIVVNGKSQTPTLIPSDNLVSTWKAMTLK